MEEPRSNEGKDHAGKQEVHYPAAMPDGLHKDHGSCWWWWRCDGSTVCLICPLTGDVECGDTTDLAGSAMVISEVNSKQCTEYK